jgi:hypothetical protein
MRPWITRTLVHGGLDMVGQAELTGAWPPTASVLKGAGQGVGEGERDTGNPFWASPEDRCQ